MSSVDSEILMTCATCGASVYREHIHRGLAGMWGGRMLCPTCLKPKRETGPLSPPAETTDDLPLAPSETEQSEVAEEPPPTAPTETPASEAIAEEPVTATGTGARQMRTFHAKLSEASLHHLDDQVNTWLKRHPQVTIKLTNTTVGVFEGKHSDPTLILTVFY
jgi:hypothetical protein